MRRINVQKKHGHIKSKSYYNISNVTKHKIFIETKICLIPLPVMCESLVSEDEFETLKKSGSTTRNSL